MPDRTEIACIIAEWAHNKREKKQLLESTITLEQFLQIDKLEPLEIVEERIQIVLQVPGGRRKVIYKEKNGKKMNGKLVDIEGKNLLIPYKLCCNDCHHQIYYPSEEEDGQAWNRDCLCADAQDYFNRSCPLKFSKSEILPVNECRFWKKEKVNVES